MKKLIMLSVMLIFTMSSFNIKENKSKAVAGAWWYVTCNGVASGSFWCNNCTQADALVIATTICAVKAQQQQ